MKKNKSLIITKVSLVLLIYDVGNKCNTSFVAMTKLLSVCAMGMSLYAMASEVLVA